MSLEIDEIKRKYNISDDGVAKIVDVTHRTGIPIHILASIYNYVSENGLVHVTT